MTTPYGEPPQDDERPQPRYGAYAPRAEEPEKPEEPSESPAEQPSTGGQPNPYGQPTWGQPGTESTSTGAPYQPGPYTAPPGGGQQEAPPQAGWQQPPPSAGYPGPAVTQKPQRPATMVISMVLMLTAAALSLIWGIYVIVTLQAQDANELMSEQMREAMVSSFANEPELQDVSPEEALDMALLGLGVFALIWSGVLLAVYTTLAFVGTMTGNAGRVLATIWLAASVLFLLLGHDGGSYGIIALTVLASFGALVLLWLPGSNEYVRNRQSFKEAQRRQPPGGPSNPGNPAQNPQQGAYGGHNPYGG